MSERHYGLKLWDKVQYPNCTKIYTVTGFDVTDNNRCRITDDAGNAFTAVCEWCLKIIIYYAHSKQIYETTREKEERAWLKKNVGNIICPNKNVGELISMDSYLEIVHNCNEIICSEYENHIGRGVFEEIKYALREKKSVRCLRKKWKKFYLIKVKDVKIIDETDWSIRYGKIIRGK